VFLDVGLLCKSSSTDDALKWLLAGMRASVLLEVKVLCKWLLTVLARQCTWSGWSAACLHYWRLDALRRSTNSITVCDRSHGLVAVCC